MKILHIGCQSSRGLMDSVKGSDAGREESFQTHRAKESEFTFWAPRFRLKTSDLGRVSATSIDKLPSSGKIGAGVLMRKAWQPLCF